MYLLYDVIQRRKSALGNSLLVKRGDYHKVQDVISSLTYQQLIEAAESLRSTQKTSDPAIATLRHALHTVAARVPNSFAAKQEMRLHLRGLFVEFGAPVINLIRILQYTLQKSEVRRSIFSLHCIQVQNAKDPTTRRVLDSAGSTTPARRSKRHMSTPTGDRVAA